MCVQSMAFIFHLALCISCGAFPTQGYIYILLKPYITYFTPILNSITPTLTTYNTNVTQIVYHNYSLSTPMLHGFKMHITMTSYACYRHSLPTDCIPQNTEHHVRVKTQDDGEWCVVVFFEGKTRSNRKFSCCQLNETHVHLQM